MPHEEMLFPYLTAEFSKMSPDISRKEPLFWIREIRILSKFSNVAEDEIRRIPFRKGMNIIWAEPPERFSPDDAQRISGHATGKTTLCRMIRYLLGESHFANESLRNSIQFKFPDGVVAGKIRLNGCDWCVARAFAGRREYAMQTASLDEFLSPQAKKGSYKDFKEEISSLRSLISNVESLPNKAELTFYHLLPLFTRDQDSQYMKLAEWRENSLSDSASPVLQQKSAMLVMRSLISDIVNRESELLSRQEELSEKQREIKSHLDLLLHVLASDRDRLKAICEDHSEDTELDQLYIEGIRETCKKRLNSFCVNEEDETEHQRLLQERDAALLEYDQAAEQYNAALRKYKQDRHTLSELRKISKSKAVLYPEEDLDEIQEAAQKHPTRKYCCVPMVIAEQHHCPWAEKYTQEEDADSMRNLVQFQGNAQDLCCDREKELQNYHSFLKKEQAHVLELEKIYADANRRLNVFAEKMNQKRNQRAAEEGYKIEAIERYDSDKKSMDDIKSQLNQCAVDLKSCKGEIAAYRKESQKVAAEFSTMYDDVIRYVLGHDVFGRVVLDDGLIKLESSYHSADLQSAALDAVKNICFDIATLLYSTIGKGTHPRFLIHDGPRVSDVTPTIYGCYFRLMHDLEMASSGNPNFQYIITTTEPPPVEFRVSPWLICKLDATDPEQRLLKCNLE